MGDCSDLRILRKIGAEKCMNSREEGNVMGKNNYLYRDRDTVRQRKSHTYNKYTHTHTHTDMQKKDTL